MRIWDLSPAKLCRRHLLAEHRELHAVWSILTRGKKGYAQHPETLRWQGRLKALYLRHEELVVELKARGYAHRSPLEIELATGESKQTQLIDSPAEQLRILRSKNCDCKFYIEGTAPPE
jgi:hypothetical protein